MFSLCGNRHCPSSAIRALSNWPFRSSLTVAVGSVNNSDGNENQKPTKIKTTINKIFADLYFINGMFIGIVSNIINQIMESTGSENFLTPSLPLNFQPDMVI